MQVLFSQYGWWSVTYVIVKKEKSWQKNLTLAFFVLGRIFSPPKPKY